jgi:RNA polymerase sigma factor (sigma-70 family)
VTAKEEEAVLLTLILEVQVMNPSDPQFQEKTTPPSGLPVSPAHWVDQCGDDLYRYALSRIGQPEVADDVVQDTLSAAVKGLGRFDRRSSEKTWLSSILKRKIADHFREQFREEKLFEDEFRSEDLEEQIRTKVIPQTQLKPADQARGNSRSHLLYDNERRCER